MLCDCQRSFVVSSVCFHFSSLHKFYSFSLSIFPSSLAPSLPPFLPSFVLSPFPPLFPIPCPIPFTFSLFSSLSLSWLFFPLFSPSTSFLPLALPLPLFPLPHPHFPSLLFSSPPFRTLSSPSLLPGRRREEQTSRTRQADVPVCLHEGLFTSAPAVPWARGFGFTLAMW